MNRIHKTLAEDKTLLSIYFTAGYPKLNDTVTIIKSLEDSGVDMIEIGLPFVNCWFCSNYLFDNMLFIRCIKN